MKNYSYLLLGSMLAAAVTSCSEDETVAVDLGHPIEFHTDMTSRAKGLTTANLEEFWVYAYTDDGKEIMPETKFTKDATSGDFVSEKKYYWPYKGTVNFVAYTKGGSSTVTLTPQEQQYKFFENAECKDHYDFLSAKATGTKQENEKNGVALNFSHRLAQVELKVKSSNDRYKIQVGYASVNCIQRSNPIYNLTNDTWSINPKGDNAFGITLETPVEVTEEAKSLTADYGNLYVVPQKKAAWDNVNDPTNSQVGGLMIISIQVRENGELIIQEDDFEITTGRFASANLAFEEGLAVNAWLPLDIDFEAGKKYTITVDFTDGLGYWGKSVPDQAGTPILGSPIKISSVEVEEWVDGDDLSVEPKE